MPTTDNQGSFLNLISIRRNQVSAMDNDQELEDLELFQKNVADLFSGLFAPPEEPSSAKSSADTQKDNFTLPPPPPLLSISWFRNLLDAFLCCEAEFKAVLVSGRDPCQFTRPPLDRLIPDLLERSVKALDICNAVTHGIHLVRRWQNLARIAVTALTHRPIAEGQVRRAKKALTALLASMALDDKEINANGNSVHASKSAERSWSFGRRGGGGTAGSKDRSGRNLGSLSWSVARSWSSAKQIQAMSANLAAPRGGESTGLALPVYIISTILVFVMWALVAAIPCQERTGLATHLPVPKQLVWAQPMLSLQERIGEDWKKKEKKGNAGLLEEVQRMERLAQSLVEFADGFAFPMEEDRGVALAAQVAELDEICGKMEEGLGPLQQQVREVFHRIVRSRAEVLEVLDPVTKLFTPVPY